MGRVCPDSHDNVPHGTTVSSGSDRIPSIRDQVFAAWVQVLRHSEFTDDTPFLDAGGHSAKATRMILILSKQIEHKLPVRMAFDHPTVRELSAAVEREVAAAFVDAD